MRPVTGALYGIPRERVVGSSVGLTYRDGNLFTAEQPEFLDEGPVKPVRPWSRIGRRPILAAGNSDGDIEMLEFTGTPATPSLRLLIWHDVAEREFAYTAGAERSGRSRWPGRTTGRSSACARIGSPYLTDDLICIPEQTAVLGSDEHYPEEAPARPVSVAPAARASRRSRRV
jgi:hypothetical protein